MALHSRGLDGSAMGLWGREQGFVLALLVTTVGGLGEQDCLKESGGREQGLQGLGPGEWGC